MKQGNKTNISLLLSVVLVAVLLLAGCGQTPKPQQTGEGAKYKLKFGTQLPDSHPITQASQVFAKKVNEKSKGQVEITVFANGSLGQERDMAEGLKLGTVDMANTSAATMNSFAPRWKIFGLPYLFESEDHMLKVVNGPIGQDLFKDLEGAGIKGLVYYYSGFRSMTTKKGPINTPDDLKGLKIRTMPAKEMVDALNAMGAIATPMDQGAVYNALQSGVLDGWENNVNTVIAFKMNEVCPYFSFTKHFMTPNVMLISLKTWNKLPPEVQKLLQEAAAENQKEQSDIFYAKEKEDMEKLKAAGMKFNEVDTKPFFEKARPLWADAEATLGKTIFEQITQLRTNK